MNFACFPDRNQDFAVQIIRRVPVSNKNTSEVS